MVISVYPNQRGAADAAIDIDGGLVFAVRQAQVKVGHPIAFGAVAWCLSRQLLHGALQFQRRERNVAFSSPILAMPGGDKNYVTASPQKVQKEI
jgi:hypothetical protein